MAIRARFPLLAALALSVALHAAFVWLTATKHWPDTTAQAISTTVSVSIEASPARASLRLPQAAPPAASPSAAPAAVPASDPSQAPLEVEAAETTVAVVPRDDVAMTPAPRLSRAALIEAIAAAVPDPVERRRFTTSNRNDPVSQYYLDALARELHRVGALNYPQAAKREGLTGSLVIAIAISHDGHLEDVRTVSSSGHTVLDDAALNIVRLAAPFTPPPTGMSANAETIEVVHTWHFTRRSI